MEHAVIILSFFPSVTLKNQLGDLTNCIIAYQNYDKAWVLSLEGDAKSPLVSNQIQSPTLRQFKYLL